MEAPVIVDDSGDVVKFGSVDDAERYIEIYDVRDGSIRAFDATGRVLNLSITADMPPRVRVSEAQDEAPDALRQVLVAYLAQVSPAEYADVVTGERPLEELVRLARPFALER